MPNEDSCRSCVVWQDEIRLAGQDGFTRASNLTMETPVCRAPHPIVGFADEAGSCNLEALVDCGRRCNVLPEKDEMQLYKRPPLSSMSVPRRVANWQQTAENDFMSHVSLHLQQSSDQTCVLRVEPDWSRSFTKSMDWSHKSPSTFVVECFREWNVSEVSRLTSLDTTRISNVRYCTLRNNSENSTCHVRFFPVTAYFRTNRHAA